MKIHDNKGKGGGAQQQQPPKKMDAAAPAPRPPAPQSAPPRVNREHNPYRLPTVAEMDKRIGDDHANTVWKWITAIGRIPSTDSEYLELSAIAASIYIDKHVPADLQLLDKWRPRKEDNAELMRKLLGKRVIPLSYTRKEATMVMSLKRDGFWNGNLTVNVINYPEAAAAGYVEGGNAAQKREATVVYTQCLLIINQALIGLKSSAERVFSLLTVGDGSPQRSGPYVAGGLLVSVDISVKLQGLALVEAIKELYTLYDESTDELRDQKIKEWSKTLMNQLRDTKAVPDALPVLLFYRFMLQCLEVNGRENDLKFMKTLLISFLAGSSNAVTLGHMEALKLPNSSLKAVIMKIDAEERALVKHKEMLRFLHGTQGVLQVHTACANEVMDENGYLLEFFTEDESFVELVEWPTDDEDPEEYDAEEQPFEEVMSPAVQRAKKAAVKAAVQAADKAAKNIAQVALEATKKAAAEAAKAAAEAAKKMEKVVPVPPAPAWNNRHAQAHSAQSTVL